MPRKKVSENEIPALKTKRKRNLPAAGHEEEKIGRNRKRKKNDTTLNGNTEEVACASRKNVVRPQSTKRIRQAASSGKLVNRRIKCRKKECAICIGTEKSSDFTVMSCDHSFHTMCLQTWFQVNKSCPVCMPVNNDPPDRSEFEDLYEFCNTAECVICLDTEEFPDFEFISCGHSFHAMCVQTWFQVKRICPICMPGTSDTDTSSIFEDEEEIGEFSEEVRCCICLDTEESSNFEIISCGHSFHVVCIQTWFGVNHVCPVCMKGASVNSSMNTLSEQDQKEDRCSICMDTEESSVFEFLPCCHSFHAKCIDTWIKQRNSCPICNTHIPVNERVTTSEAQDANEYNDDDGENLDEDFDEDYGTDSDDGEMYYIRLIRLPLNEPH